MSRAQALHCLSMFALPCNPWCWQFRRCEILNTAVSKVLQRSVFWQNLRHRVNFEELNLGHEKGRNLLFFSSNLPFVKSSLFVSKSVWFSTIGNTKVLLHLVPEHVIICVATLCETQSEYEKNSVLDKFWFLLCRPPVATWWNSKAEPDEGTFTSLPLVQINLQRWLSMISCKSQLSLEIFHP